MTGRTGPRRGGQTAPQRVADLPLFTAAALFLFLFICVCVRARVFGESSRPSRAASKHPARTAGLRAGPVLQPSFRPVWYCVDTKACRGAGAGHTPTLPRPPLPPGEGGAGKESRSLGCAPRGRLTGKFDPCCRSQVRLFLVGPRTHRRELQVLFTPYLLTCWFSHAHQRDRKHRKYVKASRRVVAFYY